MQINKFLRKCLMDDIKGPSNNRSSENESSNISLPHKTKQLVAGIHQQIFVPYIQEKKGVEENFKSNKQILDERKEKAIKSFNQDILYIDNNFKDHIEEIKKLSYRLLNELNRVKNHLINQNLTEMEVERLLIRDSIDLVYPSTNIKGEVAALIKEAERITGIIQETQLNIKLPTQPYKVVRVIVYGVLLAIGILWLLSFSEVIIYIFALCLLMIFGFFDLHIFIDRAALKTEVNKFASAINVANQLLNGWLDKVQIDYKISLEGIKNKYLSTKEDLENKQNKQKEEMAQKAKVFKIACDQFITVTKYASAYWDDNCWINWQPSSRKFQSFAAYLGRLKMAVYTQETLVIPAFIPLDNNKGLLFKTQHQQRSPAIDCVKSMILRLLATLPPGQVCFTFIDPIDLGQNVSEFMLLSDYTDKLIGGKAWSEPQHIEKKLFELTEHIETVTQKYLRGDFKTIEDYNRQSTVAEPYQVLVIFDFPTNIKEETAQRLLGIVRNGPRCGVYSLIVMSENLPQTYRFNLQTLEQSLTIIENDNNRLAFREKIMQCFTLELDHFPADQMTFASQQLNRDKNFVKNILINIGEKAKEGMRVAVPFEALLSMAGIDNSWKERTINNLKVPLGPSGAKKLQYLIFGEGTTHHGLIIGRPGSGKTNLLHVIITVLSLTYPPEELQLYLIDFKKGVGFKPYADFILPHATAIAIESEREFGLSVLQGIDAEMQKRGELFRKHSCEDIKEYRNKTSAVLARILLVADEYQEFFIQDDNISRQASLLLDRIIKQGRAFGIHILLATQTLHSTSSLSRGTLDQIAVRIALQCSEADSRIIFASDNPAARLLSRPGEAIYNSANGLIEGNNPFQVALFTDETRNKWLKQISTMADGKYTEAIIFEGNEVAKIENCKPLRDLIYNKDYPTKPKAIYSWLGEPTTIRDPVAARLRRQGGSNLLIIAREEAEGVGMLFATLLSLVTQHAPQNAKFFIINLLTSEEPWEDLPDEIAVLLPHQISVINHRNSVPLIKELWEEVKYRIAEQQTGQPAIYIFIAGLHRARALRHDAEPIEKIRYSELLAYLLKEGPETGVHILTWCDSYPNLTKVITSRQVSDFSLRVAGPMNEGDSSKLIDDVAAARLDKPHRAIFYDDDRPGYLEKFRPYGVLNRDWLERVSEQLKSRIKN